MMDAQRRWVRSAVDGQLGYLVEDGGGVRVRLDRPREEIYKRYDPHQWPDAEDTRDLSKMQIARITYEADRAYRLACGEAASVVKDWISMKDEERIQWLKRGRAMPPVRHNLRAAIEGVIGDGQ